ncbi:MAG TPA: glycerophosphodiester phosphodiesterase [Streptosporangiaceae bacterium]|nr:glycerophosphodiester phosphodiesterase [Streptosporangiaceae bacterium]
MIFDGKPSIVGHRGLGAGLRDGRRENSIASFLAAAAAGLSWVELDVRRGREGDLMVWHDPVTPAGAAVATGAAADLAAEGVVTLAEVLAALPADVAVDIDVKTIMDDAVDPPARRTHALVADVLRSEAGSRRFLVSSFDPAAVVFLAGQRDFIGDVALGLITAVDFPAQQAVPAAANLGLDAVCLHTGSLTATPEHTIGTAHRAGLEVLAWCPGPAGAVRLAGAGVDAVCVNDIAGVQAALASAIGGRD